MSLTTPDKIRDLQIKLYRKAKNEPGFRFYQLYDKMYREDILIHAYTLAKANDGASGVDGESFARIESGGLTEWLNGLGRELHDKTYKPQPVRRVMIPKPGGGERALGIPTIRDRVAQTAAKLILEPIFEADLEPNAYGYRPGRSAQDAVEKVHELLHQGYTDIVDADLSKYFDTIPHSELMQCVARRIVDKHMLHLIKMWLKVPVEERDEKGNKRLTGGKDNDRGTPQGGVISPMLANLYMNRMLKGWKQTGRAEQFRAQIVSYADDFVILSRGKANEALEWTRGTLRRLELTLNEKKTSIRDARRERFDFLGYTFGPHFSARTGRGYIGRSPSKKSVNRIKEKVGDMLKPQNVTPWDEVRDRLNQTLSGWKAYFGLGSTSKAYSVIDQRVEERVRHFLRRRHKVSSQGTRQFSMKRIFGELGVFRLRGPLRVAGS
ncbi:RNA-directed DNA polymerase (Reverse transcriptase) [Candidatus Sulfopaludibacter sp. SbA4]|nr:RNA-directed DNA polymerase (Reverse transcriptase) [Candidatus Sulfopaludibacter sp. SbA4]